MRKTTFSRVVKMAQLTLNLASRLSYSAKGFLIHDGVRDLVGHLHTQIVSGRYSVSYVVGPARSGKTHLSIECAEECMKRGKLPRLVSGSELSCWAEEQQFGEHLGKDEVVLIDDVDQHLLQALPGASGTMVTLVETLRRRGLPLLLFSGTPAERLPCDDHIMSRLKPGLGFELKHPAEQEMSELITRMAHQRGIHLGERKLQFLLKRVRRDIPSIEEYLEKLSYLSDVLGKPVRFPLLGDAL